MHQTDRFQMIDGLRGIAAMAVVFYHLQAAVDGIAAGPWMPNAISWMTARGFLGVDIFFVLSGFVIAYSTRSGPHTFGYLGRFALRRSIRLDPPYWLTIALELLVIALVLQVMPSRAPEMPTPGQLASHLIYAQNLLGHGDIVPIFWTLCFEIQFYLFFVLLLIGWRRFPLPRVATAVLISLFVLSIYTRFGPFSLQGVALERWFQFFMGVLGWWVVSGRLRWHVLLPAWGLVFVVAVALHRPEQLVAVATSALIVAAGLRQRMSQWLTHSALQFLGRISYSLYLVHAVVGWRFISLTGVVLGPVSTPVAWIIFAAGVGVSILAATLMWNFVEAPTMAWSKRVTVRVRSGATAVPTFAGP